jgi:uncharacterized protein GlcG (DUF336 family)
VPPILEYSRAGRGPAAVIGGHVYRGAQVPALRGAYVFGDYDGRVFEAREGTGGKWAMRTMLPSNTDGGGGVDGFLHSFGEDAAGELYVLSAQVMREPRRWRLQRVVSADLTSAEIDALLDAGERAARDEISDLRRDAGNGPTSPKMHVSVATPSNTMHTRSMHDAWPGSWDVSRAKAFTAMAFSSDESALTTRSLGEQSQTGPWSKDRPPLHGIGHSNPQRGVVEFPGGLPVYKRGRRVGGLGVSGDAVDVDERVAMAALPRENWPRHQIRIDVVTGGEVQYVKIKVK